MKRGNGTPSEPEWVIWFDARIEPEGKWFTAIFDALEISGVGSTPDEAVENLKEHIQSHWAALDEKGVLKEILESKGVMYDEREGKIPVVVCAATAARRALT